MGGCAEILNHLHRSWGNLSFRHWVGGGHYVIQQGRHAASHNCLAFPPFLDLRVVVPGRIRATSHSCQRKQAKEGEASKGESGQRGRQGRNVATKLRGHAESRRG